jgi:hypothetical protein
VSHSAANGGDGDPRHYFALDLKRVRSNRLKKCGCRVTACQNNAAESSQRSRFSKRLYLVCFGSASRKMQQDIAASVDRFLHGLSGKDTDGALKQRR